MTSTISNWYHNQYASWNRTRRLHAPTFIARTDSQAARAARVAAGNTGTNGDTVINMGDILSPERSQASEKKKRDTLFGPSIGVVNPGPDWAQETQDVKEKVKIQDTLTPDLVKSWAEKSKEGSQATTTLQALVNLKRPSLRLSPITHDEPEDPDPSQPVHHGLEFQFDCDAPKCRITLHVIPPVSGKEFSSSAPKPIVLFNMVVDGGFSRTLKLEEGAMLELNKYDSATQSSDKPDSQTHLPYTGAAAASASQTALPSLEQPPTNAPQGKKRFHLRIRKRTHPHAAEDTTRLSVAGPALQVVDMEAPSSTENTHKEKDEDGVKIFIKLEALDVNEHSLASRNSQTTYLHIVRLGPSPESGSSDARPWVVRVAKREATIGPHTFHLHEIYGLGSHTSNAPHPSPNNNETTHSYPPTSAVDNDDPTSECLLCLSSPREVVLLPCRHLVACKECAVNMVEFGAGGQLVHAEETVEVMPSNNNGAADTVGGEGSGANGEDLNAGGVTTTITTAPATQTRPRRKRKPKGWFCPVCRQPYTSLLRISTGSPVCVLNNKTKDLDQEDRASSPDTLDSHSHPHPHPHSHRPLSLETVTPSPVAENAGGATVEEAAAAAAPHAHVPADETAAPHLEDNHSNDTNEGDITESGREEAFHDAYDYQDASDTTQDAHTHVADSD